jgi:hypothetical protein
MKGKESVSFTRALLSISVAKVYLEDMIVDFPGMKRRIDQWIARLSFVSTDALSCMTDQGREVYRREIQKKDFLLFEHLFQLLAAMTPEQRSLIERAAESLLKGEIEITES